MSVFVKSAGCRAIHSRDPPAMEFTAERTFTPPLRNPARASRGTGVCCKSTGTREGCRDVRDNSSIASPSLLLRPEA
ncbi:hypothetical protein DES52_110173 [Deinococcus yavapaiensis KR-236]|uniref:Uncharacterized protein n=1 Tax=Deinococcus yavapaiensis KR-236 TaxID=694435 RepID=A0A318S452_9DEIO|nr:hypothetical protein DES52_110173 [Deinococcus yavapaiensis KR-236]